MIHCDDDIAVAGQSFSPGAVGLTKARLAMGKNNNREWKSLLGDGRIGQGLSDEVVNEVGIGSPDAAVQGQLAGDVTIGEQAGRAYGWIPEGGHERTVAGHAVSVGPGRIGEQLLPRPDGVGAS